MPKHETVVNLEQAEAKHDAAKEKLEEIKSTIAGICNELIPAPDDMTDRARLTSALYSAQRAQKEVDQASKEHIAAGAKWQAAHDASAAQQQKAEDTLRDAKHALNYANAQYDSLWVSDAKKGE